MKLLLALAICAALGAMVLSAPTNDIVPEETAAEFPRSHDAPLLQTSSSTKSAVDLDAVVAEQLPAKLVSRIGVASSTTANGNQQLAQTGEYCDASYEKKDNKRCTNRDEDLGTYSSSENCRAACDSYAQDNGYRSTYCCSHCHDCSEKTCRISPDGDQFELDSNKDRWKAFLYTCASCDASAAPANGAVGDCTSSLASGSTCQPTCNTGYTVSGSSSCSAGTLTAATCYGYTETDNRRCTDRAVTLFERYASNAEVEADMETWAEATVQAECQEQCVSYAVSHGYSTTFCCSLHASGGVWTGEICNHYTDYKCKLSTDGATDLSGDWKANWRAFVYS